MHNFRICVIFVYGNCAYTMQINKRCAHTEDMHIVVHIFRICTISVYRICTYLRSCIYIIYAQISYTKISHIRKICAYTEIAHKQKICAYLRYIPNFPICAYLPYMHVVYVSTSYMHKFHIQKLRIYGNCAP